MITRDLSSRRPETFPILHYANPTIRLIDSALFRSPLEKLSSDDYFCSGKQPSILHVMNALSRSLSAYWFSSIGKKLIVAITGIVLVLFLAGHLTGNLLIYVGRDAFNEYAHFLHTMIHGTGIWIARIVLLTMLIAHVVATICLTRENRAAGHKYECSATIQASSSSRIMIWSGLTILAFVIFHILHYTVRVNMDLAKLGATDPFGMVVVGFQNPFVVLFYVISMTLLCSHLSHGVASIFQTLGFRSKKSKSLIHQFSVIYSLVIWIGFISIPISIYAGFVKF
jgi:succinate dehydrogenase / fumarate reductase cytochrome b subunit